MLRYVRIASGGYLKSVRSWTGVEPGQCWEVQDFRTGFNLNEQACVTHSQHDLPQLSGSLYAPLAGGFALVRAKGVRPNAS
jgi:hypothetical protein